MSENLYWSGVLATLFFDLGWAYYYAVPATSGWRKHNLRSIGLRISWSTGEYKEVTPWYKRNAKWARPLKILWSIAWIGIFSFTSWFGFFFTTARIVVWFGGLLTMVPEFEKEYLHELSTRNLSQMGTVNAICKYLKLDNEEKLKMIQGEINPRLESLGETLVDTKYLERRLNTEVVTS